MMQTARMYFFAKLREENQVH